MIVYKSIRLVLYLIVLFLFIYVIYSNIKPFGGIITKKMDIGIDYNIYPSNRITDVKYFDGTGYRELTDSFVYFDMEKIPRANKIKIIIKFKDETPNNYSLKIGGKNKEEWNYIFNNLEHKQDITKEKIYDEQNEYWTIGETTFDLKDLYLWERGYNFVLNADHLRNEEYKNMTIPIDWIEVEYHIPPLI